MSVGGHANLPCADFEKRLVPHAPYKCAEVAHATTPPTPAHSFAEKAVRFHVGLEFLLESGMVVAVVEIVPDI